MPDRRVKYTRQALRQSLLALMREKDIRRITVKELCARADVNRGTFYAHYVSPADLLSQIEGELLAEIQQSLEALLRPATISDLLTDIFSTIRKNGDLCQVLLSSAGDEAFLHRIILIAREPCLREWASAAPGVTQEVLGLLFTFLSSGSVGVIRAWVDDGMRAAPEEVAQLIYRLSESTLRAVIAS